jgi:hypothetical protein
MPVNSWLFDIAQDVPTLLRVTPSGGPRGDVSSLPLHVTPRAVPYLRRGAGLLRRRVVAATTAGWIAGCARRVRRGTALAAATPAPFASASTLPAAARTFSSAASFAHLKLHSLG